MDSNFGNMRALMQVFIRYFYNHKFIPLNTFEKMKKKNFNLLKY